MKQKHLFPFLLLFLTSISEAGRRHDLAGLTIAVHNEPAVFIVDAEGRRRWIANADARLKCRIDIGGPVRMHAHEFAAIDEWQSVYGHEDCAQFGQRPRPEWAGKVLKGHGDVHNRVYVGDKHGGRFYVANKDDLARCGLYHGNATHVEMFDILKAPDAGVLGGHVPCNDFRGSRPDLAGLTVSAPGDRNTWVVDATGVRRHITSDNARVKCGFDLGGQLRLPPNELHGITDGGAVHGHEDCGQFGQRPRPEWAGKTVQGHNDGHNRVYLVDHKGARYFVPNNGELERCGLNPHHHQRVDMVDILKAPDAGILGVHVSCGEFPGAKQHTISGSIDPVAEIRRVKPDLGFFLNPLVGVLTLHHAQGPQPQNNEVFVAEGQLNTREIAGNHPLAHVLRTVTQAGRSVFGLQETVHVKAALSFANNEWDLSLAIRVADSFEMTGELIPVAKPQLAFKSADLVLHAKQPIGGPMGLSAEFTGDMFFKPTGRDPWLALRPTLEVHHDARLTIGGAITGACGGAINGGTHPNHCNQIWNIFGLPIIQTRSGLLKLTLDPKAPPAYITGIETAIQNGKFNGVLDVDGALITDVDASPGFGLALAVRQNDPVAFFKANPVANQQPFAALATSIPEEARASAERTIVIAPTAMSVGHINYPRPTFEFRTAFSGSGAGGSFNANVIAKLDGDVDIQDLLSDRPLQERPRVNATMNAQYNFGATDVGTIKYALSQIPGMELFRDQIASTFKFHGLTISAERLPNNNYQGKAIAGASVMGRNFSVNIPLSVQNKQGTQYVKMRPQNIASYIGEEIARNFGNYGDIILQTVVNMDARAASQLAQEVGKQFATGNVEQFGQAFSNATNIVKGMGLPIPGEVTDAADDVADALSNAAEALNPTSWW